MGSHLLGRFGLRASKHMQFRLSRAKQTSGIPRAKVDFTNLSYAHGASDVKLLYQTVGETLRLTAEKQPDREFAIFRDKSVHKSFAQVYEEARQFGAALLELGLRPGDRVGVWGHNYYEWILCLFGTAIAGLVQVNINPAYKSEELTFALKKVGVRCIVTPKEHKHCQFLKDLTQVVPEIETGRPGIGRVRNHELPELEHIIIVRQKQHIPGAWKFEDLMSGMGSDARLLLDDTEQRVRPDDPVNIQYTSGTTGFPKAATLSHNNIVNNANNMGRRTGWDEQYQRLCIPTPLYHCFGSVIGVMNATVHGLTCIFPSESYDPVKTLQAVEAEKATYLYGTPTMFIDTLSHFQKMDKKADLSSLKGAWMAGSPCPQALCEKLLKEIGIREVVIGYGTTELSPVVTMSDQKLHPMERIKTVGTPLPHTELLIVDDCGIAVPKGEKGELWARGYMTMLGYYNDREKTEEAISADRWYHTGDTGVMNEDGTISIVGRMKDMIIRGGENIYPNEIEQFIFKLEGVADVQVVGVPDERHGEAVCAWVKPKPGYSDTITQEYIQDKCKEKIAYYKVPKYVIVKEDASFPLTVTGKVKKYELRELTTKLLDLEHIKPHFNE